MSLLSPRRVLFTTLTLSTFVAAAVTSPAAASERSRSFRPSGASPRHAREVSDPGESSASQARTGSPPRSIGAGASDSESGASTSVAQGPARASDDPSVVGRWEGVRAWPEVAIHLIQLHTGKVLWFAGHEEDAATYTWDPVTDEHESQIPGEEIFCSGHSALPDGRILVTGGTIPGTFNGASHTAIFDPSTSTWSAGPDMRSGRYYPTNLVLGDGRTLVFSGRDEFGRNDPQVEIFDQGGGPGGTDTWDLLSGAENFMDIYPRMHLLPNGLVFHACPERASETLDPAAGAWQVVAESNYGPRDSASTVLVPPGFDRVMLLGGRDLTVTDDFSATDTVETIDTSAPAPSWTYAAPMHFRRMFQNAVILPDGTILVAGGDLANTSPQHPVLPAEIFDPATGAWSVVAAMGVGRLYHSSAILLPDGRALWAGGNVNPTAETYAPPYLFRGARPEIGSVPESVGYGQTFSVSTQQAQDIGSVVFMRPGASTHGQNMEQRYVPVTFTAPTGGTLRVTAPASGNIAPPGYYMLFILDRNGVPSVSRFVRLDVPSANQPPTVNAGPDRAVAMPSLAVLFGTVSDDHLPAGSVLKTTWTVVRGKGRVRFIDPYSPHAFALFSSAGTYVLRLTADDGSLRGSDDVTIEVSDPLGIGSPPGGDTWGTGEPLD